MNHVVVFKFGGASVKDADAVKNVADILNANAHDHIMVVVSAMGKTTNALEHIHQLWRSHHDCSIAVEGIRQFHQQLADELKIDSADWHHHFADLELRLSKRCDVDFDQSYDDMVSCGELFSSAILYAYLKKRGIQADWLDARSIIRTDNRFRDARVDFSECVVNELMMWKRSNAVGVTQGFIGADAAGNTTTLGREGSDYTAAILAFLLQAREVIIWKDVPGMMNADPRWFPEARKVSHISFHEAVELAYYGASVIHPKTIKPLQNLGIPLYIKSFERPAEEGTLIHGDADGEGAVHHLILKTSQALVSIYPNDFSFILEDNLRDIFDALSAVGVRVRLMENSAISFSFVTDDDARKLDSLRGRLEGKFAMRFNRPVTLLTIRHYTPEIAERYTASREVLLEQRNRTSLRLVMRAIPAEIVPQKS